MSSPTRLDRGFYVPKKAPTTLYAYRTHHDLEKSPPLYRGDECVTFLLLGADAIRNSSIYFEEELYLGGKVSDGEAYWHLKRPYFKDVRKVSFCKPDFMPDTEEVSRGSQRITVRRKPLEHLELQLEIFDSLFGLEHKLIHIPDR